MLYLIKREPKPDYYRVPYHPVIICDRKPVAREEAGGTDALACLWSHEPNMENTGWLYERWMGLDIDYHGLVKGVPLPNGEQVAFCHDREQEPWTLIAGAVWWSDRRMPEWLAKRGVVYPEDRFTQQWILDRIANLKGPDGYWGPLAVSVSGFGRPVPQHWQKEGPAGG